MSLSDWKVPVAAQPRGEDYDYDLDRVLSAVVGIRSLVPPDAFTAETLGVERVGNGVFIRDGVVLTIGYLITEAETIWIGLADGQAVPGHVLGYDQQTGFGLVQALARLRQPTLELGDSGAAKVGDRVVVGAAGGRTRSLAARIVGKQEFAGYWEYVLDEALFTAPSHPHWGGTAVLDARGRVVGVGSLQLQTAEEGGGARQLNMVVPIDLLKPILDDLSRFGRRAAPARPWLGLFATSIDGNVVVVGLAGRGPAQAAGLRTGDVVLAVAGERVADLAGFFRRVWALGEAGVEVPLTIGRDGKTTRVVVASGDRASFLKSPSLH